MNSSRIKKFFPVVVSSIVADIVSRSYKISKIRWIVFNFLLPACMSAYLVKIPNGDISSVVFGICSVLGIYISMSISVLIQVQNQSSKYLPGTYIGDSLVREYKSRWLKNIFYLLVLSIISGSMVIIFLLLQLYFPADFFKSVTGNWFTAVGYNINLRILLSDVGWRCAVFFSVILALVYYEIIRSVFYLFSDDITYGP